MSLNENARFANCAESVQRSSTGIASEVLEEIFTRARRDVREIAINFNTDTQTDSQ